MTNTTAAFSLEDLTLGEIGQLEDLTGQSLSDFSDDSAPKAKFLTALAYLAKRRSDPKYTFSMAETLKLSDLNAILEANGPGEADAA